VAKGPKLAEPAHKAPEPASIFSLPRLSTRVQLLPTAATVFYLPWITLFDLSLNAPYLIALKIIHLTYSSQLFISLS